MVDILNLIDTGPIFCTKESEKANHFKREVQCGEFFCIKRAFLDDAVTTVEMEEILPEMILNWDQTGIKLVPSTSWSMEQRGVRRIEVRNWPK